MATKLRLQRKGRKKRPFYHIVVADERAPRDGRFIEKIGIYNPMTSPATIDIDRDRAFEWLMLGAQPTDTVRAILRFKGVMYRKHLQRGVSKGAMTQEAADKLYLAWIEAKESNISDRFAESAAKQEAFLKSVDGTAPVIVAPVVEEVVVEAKPEAPAVEAAPEVVVEAPAAEEKAPEVVEVAPVVEEKAPEVVEAAPVVEEKAPEVVAEAPKADVKPDDLKKIEGIGPKIAEILVNAGIPTFEALSNTDAAKVKEILSEAGNRYKMHDPTTWPTQAKMAAEGKWDELKVWQDEHDGGRPKE